MSRTRALNPSGGVLAVDGVAALVPSFFGDISIPFDGVYV
jgi:hypothetical protein